MLRFPIVSLFEPRLGSSSPVEYSVLTGEGSSSAPGLGQRTSQRQGQPGLGLRIARYPFELCKTVVRSDRAGDVLRLASVEVVGPDGVTVPSSQLQAWSLRSRAQGLFRKNLNSPLRGC